MVQRCKPLTGSHRGAGMRPVRGVSVKGGGLQLRNIEHIQLFSAIVTGAPKPTAPQQHGVVGRADGLRVAT